MQEREQRLLYYNIGNQIALLRKKSGFSQSDLANAVELSRASIVNIEKGRQQPSLHLLIDLSRIFNVKLGDLILDKNFKNISYTASSRIKKELTKTTKGDSRVKVEAFLKDITA